MKKFFILVAAVATAHTLSAQKLDKNAENLMTTPAITYQQQQYVIGNETAAATTVVINAPQKEYNKDLNNYLKTILNLEGKKNSGYTSALNVVVSQWSVDPLSFHYKTEKDGNGTKLIVITQQNGRFVTAETDPELATKINASLSSQIKGFYLTTYDKYISTQQKYYDAQVKDLDKLRKNLDKTHTKIDSNNKSKQKSEGKLRDARSGVSKKDGDIKSLNSKLANNKKAVDQAQKEVDAQAILVTDKEGEYNRLNYSGSLGTKEGEKVIKDLNKLRKKQEKNQSKLAKANAERAKTENALLKAEQGKSKQEAKVTDLQSNIDSQDTKNTNLQTDLNQVQKEISAKQAIVDEARATLDRLKTAKDGLSSR